MNNLLLLSRPRDDSAHLAELLRRDFPTGQIGIFPVLEIEYETTDLPEFDFDAVIFTSRHAVQKIGLPPNVPAFCTGPATARRAQDAGFDIQYVAHTAEGLLPVLEASAFQKFLYLRGETARFDFEKRLKTIGKSARASIVYRQVHRTWAEAELNQVMAAARIIAPVFSPLTATLLGEKLRDYGGPIDLIAISEATRDAWSGPETDTITLAAAPNGASMEQAIRSQLSRSRLEGPTIRD